MAICTWSWRSWRYPVGYHHLIKLEHIKLFHSVSLPPIQRKLGIAMQMREQTIKALVPFLVPSVLCIAGPLDTAFPISHQISPHFLTDATHSFKLPSPEPTDSVLGVAQRDSSPHTHIHNFNHCENPQPRRHAHSEIKQTPQHVAIHIYNNVDWQLSFKIFYLSLNTFLIKKKKKTAGKK